MIGGVTPSARRALIYAELARLFGELAELEQPRTPKVAPRPRKARTLTPRRDEVAEQLPPGVVDLQRARARRVLRSHGIPTRGDDDG